MNILVSELYDRLTVQGEGPSIGQVCSMIRLAGCNLQCVFCDSAFTWGFNKEKIKNHKYVQVPFNPSIETKRISIEDIGKHFAKLNPPMIVITGGEPMLQAKKLPALMAELINRVNSLNRIEIETAGTIFDEEVANFPFVYFNVSPKLSNSGNSKENRYKPDVLRQFVEKGANFKFVVSNKEDLKEVAEIVVDVGIPIRKVWIMPEGITSNNIRRVTQQIVEEALKYRFNITTRLHVLIWDNQRGV